MSTNDHHPLLHIISGASAGLLADASMHPVDTIRARLQTQSHNQQLYKNTIHAFYVVIRNEGVRALYKGLPIVAAATIPAHGVYFTAYETSKKFIYPNTPQEQKGPLVHFVSGSIADFFGTLVWSPMDVVKQRLQVQRANQENIKYKGSLHAFTTILKEEGPRGLYRGLLASIITYGPMSGVYFATYEKLKSSVAKFRNSSISDLPFYFHVGCGATAGAFAAGVTCPLDVVKTRIQVLSGEHLQEYKGINQAVRTIMKEEGIRGFWKGIGARMLWLGPYYAITISTYEQFKKFYGPLLGGE